MDKRIANAALWCALIFVPATASAYVGPGAGLSLLGALWALLVALVTALAFIVAWPVRRMLRRKREARAEASRAAGAESPRAAGERPEERPRAASLRDPQDDEALPSKRP